MMLKCDMLGEMFKCVICIHLNKNPWNSYAN